MELNVALIIILYGLIIFKGELLSKLISPFISRKISHILCGLITASLPFFVNFQGVIYICVILMLLVVTTKLLNIFKGIELSEKRNWGTLYFPIGILLTAILFWNTNTLYFIFGIIVLGISDPLAAIVGKSFGTHKLPFVKHKTYEGSYTFFITTFCIYFLIVYFKSTSLIVIDYRIMLIGIAGSIVVTCVEALSLKGTDNILIPVVAGAIMSLVM